MYGSTIKLAVEALKLFLYSLPSGCRFNVVSFGSYFSFMFENSVEYNDVNLERAVKEIVNFDADMGGTEILAPIKNVF
jgi:von Willebrand factor A domain-containing protein 5